MTVVSPTWMTSFVIPKVLLNMYTYCAKSSELFRSMESSSDPQNVSCLKQKCATWAGLSQQMESESIQRILQLSSHKTPTNVGELRKLLRFLSYYLAYAQDFFRIAKPFYDLLQVKRSPENQHMQVFQILFFLHQSQRGACNTCLWLTEHTGYTRTQSSD